MVRVFISYTQQDLSEYCKAAEAACTALGFTPVSMPNFEATHAGGIEGSLIKVATCQVLVGLYAHRYGSVIPPYTKSVTELEYEHALERGMDCLCFLIDPRCPWDPSLVDKGESYTQLEAFKARLEQRHIRAHFRGVEDLRNKVQQALLAWQQARAAGPADEPDLVFRGARRPSRAIRPTWQLPAEPQNFVGRTALLEELTSTLMHHPEDKGCVMTGLHGMGGIGKTCIAIKLAHRLAPRYHDGQLFIDLHGDQPTPRAVGEVMISIIRTFEPEADIPPEPERLLSLYRHVLHDKRALLILDNAANKAQVEPLLPPGACMLIVTARQDFIVGNCLRRRVDQLTSAEAEELLHLKCRRLGSHAAALARLCGYLPLALACAGETLAVLTLEPTEYIARLAQAMHRLDLSDGNRSIRATIQTSYALLEPGLQQRFLALAVFRADFDRAAAAALWHVAESVDAGLTLSRLVQLSSQERYHDAVQLRQRCVELARELYDNRALAQALDNLGMAYERLGDYQQALTHYVQAAELAETVRAQATLGTALGHIASMQPPLEDPAAALPHYARVLEMLRQHQDNPRLAKTLNHLGLVHERLRDYQQALTHYVQAVELAEDIGFQTTFNDALTHVAEMKRRLGDSAAAVPYYARTLAALRQRQDTAQLAQREDTTQLAWTVDYIGIAYEQMGEYAQALAHYVQAATLA